jgi:hypothetical protein
VHGTPASRKLLEVFQLMQTACYFVQTTAAVFQLLHTGSCCFAKQPAARQLLGYLANIRRLIGQSRRAQTSQNNPTKRDFGSDAYPSPLQRPPNTVKTQTLPSATNVSQGRVSTFNIRANGSCAPYGT